MEGVSAMEGEWEVEKEQGEVLSTLLSQRPPPERVESSVAALARRVDVMDVEASSMEQQHCISAGPVEPRSRLQLAIIAPQSASRAPSKDVATPMVDSVMQPLEEGSCASLSKEAANQSRTSVALDLTGTTGSVDESFGFWEKTERMIALFSSVDDSGSDDNGRNQSQFLSRTTASPQWQFKMQAALNMLAESDSMDTTAATAASFQVVDYSVSVLLQIVNGREGSGRSAGCVSNTNTTHRAAATPYNRLDFLQILLCAMQRHARSAAMNAMALYVLHHDLTHRSSNRSGGDECRSARSKNTRSSSHRHDLKQVLLDLGNQVVNVMESFSESGWIQELALNVLLAYTIGRPAAVAQVTASTSFTTPPAAAAPNNDASSKPLETLQVASDEELAMMEVPTLTLASMFFDADFWFSTTYAICSALTRHFVNHAAVAQAALSLLAWLCEDAVFRSIVWTFRPSVPTAFSHASSSTSNDPIKECATSRPVRRTMVDTIVTIMRLYANNPSIQASAAATLTWLLSNPLDSAATATMTTTAFAPHIAVVDHVGDAARIVYTVGEAIENHMDSACVFGNGVCVLAAVAPLVPADGVDWALHHKLFHVIVEGMMRHGRVSKVQVCCLSWILQWQAVALTRQPERLQFIQTTLLPHIICGMHEHGDEARLQATTCLVLTAMVHSSGVHDIWRFSTPLADSTTSASTGTSSNKTTVVDAALTAWRNHAHNPAVVNEAVLLLHTLLRAAVDASTWTGADRSIALVARAFGGGVAVLDAIWSAFQNDNEDD